MKKILKMKKIISIALVCLLFIFGIIFALINMQTDITGKWAEKTSERVVMDILPDKNEGEYLIFITWREDNLAQKDIYRLKAKLDTKGELKYQNGIHLYRIYDKNKFEDKADYSNGTGTIIIKNTKLIWINNKDNSKTEFIRANKSLRQDTTVKNKYFSFIMPEELKGLYDTKIENDKIAVYHKQSKNAGFEGFAFGIKLYKTPSEHANLPGGKKIGELKDKKGTYYDVVLKYPTDVQYDYTKSPKAPESYELLYDVGAHVNIIGINGAKYFKNKGMLGKDLYKNILKRHVKAIKKRNNAIQLEKQGISYMYYVLAQKTSSMQEVLDRVGYVYYDVNEDGIEELLIGEITDGKWKGIIYDIYTMVNRKPKHVISGGSRNRYFVCDDAFICNEYSVGANESGLRVYTLSDNSTELFSQVSFKHDGYKDPQNPWFISYGAIKDQNSWYNVPEETFNDRKKVFDKYQRFDFIPLKNVKS